MVSMPDSPRTYPLQLIEKTFCVIPQFPISWISKISSILTIAYAEPKALGGSFI